MADVFKKAAQFDAGIDCDAVSYFTGLSITGVSGGRVVNSAIGNATSIQFSFISAVALATTFDATETNAATISGMVYTIAKRLADQGLF